MQERSECLSRLLQDLRALQQQLGAASETPSAERLDSILDLLFETGVMENLQASLDTIGQFLWLYIESAATQKAAPATDLARQSERLLQATEMLRRLRPAGAESHGFVESTMLSMDRLTRPHPEHPEAA